MEYIVHNLLYRHFVPGPIYVIFYRSDHCPLMMRPVPRAVALWGKCDAKAVIQLLLTYLIRRAASAALAVEKSFAYYVHLILIMQNHVTSQEAE